MFRPHDVTCGCVLSNSNNTVLQMNRQKNLKPQDIGKREAREGQKGIHCLRYPGNVAH
jgi:hypothetical protein